MVTEVVELDRPEVEGANPHQVQVKQWRKWSVLARLVFDEVYEFMLNNQWAFNHPKSPEMNEEGWRTVSWNAAWTAAEAVRNNAGAEWRTTRT